jgi:hypothetical protein
MARKANGPSYLVISDLRGGRNGLDPPWAIADNQCVDAVNIEWWRTRLGRRRNGGISVPPPVGSGLMTGFEYIAVLMRHMPGADETTAELWAVQGVFPTFSKNFNVISAPDSPAPLFSGIDDICGQSINGQFMLAYQTVVALDRLHVWDGTVIRRTGIAAPSNAPIPTDIGAGAYPATLRYYRTRLIVQQAGLTIRRGEASPSVGFTPSGSGGGAQVTLIGVPDGETATHWELEASVDGVTFYRIATVIIATTVYVDSALIATYNANPLSALAGTYQLQRNYRFLAADQNRLIGFGAMQGLPRSRVEFSAVIGSLDVGDEERVDATTNYFVDLDERGTGDATGIGGPINGSYLAFKFRNTYLLTPTGQTTQPFKVIKLSGTVGCIAHKSIAIGEDANGNPAVYWMSHRGPYRYGANGMEYLGRGVEDLLLNQIVLQQVIGVPVPAHTVYHADKRQVWFWVAVEPFIFPPTRRLVKYDVVSGGWSRDNGQRLVHSCCSVMFSDAASGGTSTLNLKPYTGSDESQNLTVLSKWDTGTTDPDSNFLAYVTSKAYQIAGPGHFCQVGQSWLMAEAAPAVSIAATVIADYGKQSKTAFESLSPTGTESHVRVILQDSDFAGDMTTVQFSLGDGGPVNASWSLEQLVTPVIAQEPGVE